jgi:hypothetical protein
VTRATGCFEYEERAEIGQEADTQQSPAYSGADRRHQRSPHEIVDQPPEEGQRHKAIIEPSIEYAADEEKEQVLPPKSPPIEIPVGEQRQRKENCKSE